MPRKAASLTAAKVQKAGPGRYGDGGGLYLLVRPNGTRFWLFRYVRDKRMRELGLGAAGSGTGLVSLAEARGKAANLMRMVKAGVDPLEQREADAAAAKAAAQTEAIRRVTFKEAALRYIDAHKVGWRNAKHHAQWRATLAAYAYPHFGDVPVADVTTKDLTTKHVLAALEPIWSTKPETAGRVRGRIETVLNDAKTRGLCIGENPAAWKGHLANSLPSRAKMAPVPSPPGR